MSRPIEALVSFGDGARWLHLTDPVVIIETHEPAEVAGCLRDIEALAAARGRYAAGYVPYEAGVAFGLAAQRSGHRPTPLVWFALFDRAQVVDRPIADREYLVGPPRPSVDLSEFQVAFDEIRRHIADGDTYQVNFTFRLRSAFRGDARSCFADLSAVQRGRHAMFLRTNHVALCSASPELFFEREQTRVTTRPMKGTARRGRFPSEDRSRADTLFGSLKERAENVMVVDMVRNDLGRVAAIGSVDVPELFSLEPYPNVWQMTSTVTARSTARLDEIFEAMFPSASVTGAPKHRTMQIISRLEKEPRGVYTGAVGIVAPDGRASFNVAIRTAVIDESAGALDFGVGSGIVWDSDVEREYEECLLKGSVLGHRPSAFDLLETMRWSPDEGFVLLDRHLARLRESARYFSYPYSELNARESLVREVQKAATEQRVRLLLSMDGSVNVEVQPIRSWTAPLAVRLAAMPIDSTNPFFFHKTTNRAEYDRRADPKFDDVLLWNSRREITESTIANIVIERDGRRVTPPVECGLLAGTFRAELLARGAVVEAPISIDDLAAADRVWLVNSVRGWCPAVLIDVKPSSRRVV